MKESLSVWPSFRQIILWGVPSITFLGCVGVVSWRWYRKPTSKNSSTPPAACCRCESNSTICTTGLGHSPASGKSGVVDQGDASRKTAEKDSQDDQVAAPLSQSLTLARKQMTSSNLRLPSLGLESEAPTINSGSSASTSNHIPPIEPESCLEINSTSSSEGLLSHPSESPDSAIPLSSVENDAQLSDSKKDSNHTAVSRYQPKIETEEDVSAAPESNGTPFVGRKDRIRVMIQIPRDLVGRFIGKQGRNIKALMLDSNGAHVYINQKNLPNDAQAVLCTVQGTSSQLEVALKIIETKYPEIEIPTYTGICSVLNQTASSLFNSPPGQNGESWDVELLPAFIPTTSFSAMVCYIESLTSVWLVACEKSVELDEQHQSMSYTYCYTSATGNNRAPLPKENDKSLLGKFCAVRVSEIHWLRGRVARFGDDTSSYEVQLMDYGSFVVVPPSAIKPLRKEHSQLPVQAFKARIAHIEAKNGAPESGLVSLQHMVEGIILEVHITGTLEKSTTTLINSSSPLAVSQAAITSASSPPTGDATQSAKITPPRSNDSAPTASDSSPLPNTNDVSPSAKDVSPSAKDVPTNANGPASGAEGAVELPPLASYTPLVELYSQLGAQTPMFINHELVELGFASWREDCTLSSDWKESAKSFAWKKGSTKSSEWSMKKTKSSDDWNEGSKPSSEWQDT